MCTGIIHENFARLNTMGFTVERLEKFAPREEELALSKHFKKGKEEAAAAADGGSMAPDFDDLATPASSPSFGSLAHGSRSMIIWIYSIMRANINHSR